MESDESVLAIHEYGRIIGFLTSRMDAGALTEDEWKKIKGEEARVHHEVGYIDGDGHFAMADGEEFAAVARRVNHLMRSKVTELHPELTEDLDRWIAEKRFPLPPLPAELEVPGVALRQYRDLIKYVEDKSRKGLISDDHAYGATDLAAELFSEHGIERFTIGLETDKAVLHGAAQVIRRKLLEFRPDLAEEIDRLGRGGLGK